MTYKFTRKVQMKEDKLNFRAVAEEKIKAGKAMTFDMDLEGVNGPHRPQRLSDVPGETPLRKAEKQLRQYKASGMMGGLSEAGKLRVVEGEVEWTGVEPKSKEAILAREVNFSKIERSAFEFVFQDIAHDKGRRPDDTVARKLYESAHRPKGNAPIDRSADYADPGYQRAVDEAARMAAHRTNDNVHLARPLPRHRQDRRCGALRNARRGGVGHGQSVMGRPVERQPLVRRVRRLGGRHRGFRA